MSLFDRHKPSGNFFPAQLVPAQEVHHQSGGVDRSLYNQVADGSRANHQAYLDNRATSLERRAINAGLRAALREALKALREQNPRHSLLDKAYRQKLFNVYEKQEQERIKASQASDNSLSHVPPLAFNKKPDEHIMEDIF